jgi:ABC-type multidrug transport system fused ATPase/permease subunit
MRREPGVAAVTPRALLFELLRPQRRRAFFGALVLVAATLVHLVVPSLLGSVVDAAIGMRAASRLNQRALALVVVAVTQAALTFAATLLLRAVAERMITTLRARLCAHLLRLPLSFHQTTRSGELVSMSTSDLGALQQALASVPALAIPAPFIIVGSLVLMLRQSVTLTLLILAAAPLMVAAVRIFGRRIQRASAAVQTAAATANGSMQEALAAIETVQASRNEALHDARYEREIEDAYRSRMRHVVAEAAFSGAIGLAAFAAFLAAFWLGGRLVIRGEISSGALVALLAYATYLQGATSSLTQVVGSAQSALGALRRTLALLSLPAPHVAPSPSPRRLAGDVSFEAVSFRYAPESRAAVDDVTLRVAAGTVCALVGASGSGKTTLARLLLRLHEVDAGRIRIGGTDIASVSTDELRRSLAYVPQDPVLFTGTIADNIRYGRPGASDAAVAAAARSAYVDEFVGALPAGLDTWVGERGATLSGGQRQRIAIARAVLANPSVLVLDEATSALDDESERWVQRALDELRHGRTTLVIAHRQHSIDCADQVAVLAEGRLVTTPGTVPVTSQVDAARTPRVA